MIDRRNFEVSTGFVEGLVVVEVAVVVVDGVVEVVVVVVEATAIVDVMCSVTLVFISLTSIASSSFGRGVTGSGLITTGDTGGIVGVISIVLM